MASENTSSSSSTATVSVVQNEATPEPPPIAPESTMVDPEQPIANDASLTSIIDQIDQLTEDEDYSSFHERKEQADDSIPAGEKSDSSANESKTGDAASDYSNNDLSSPRIATRNSIPPIVKKTPEIAEDIAENKKIAPKKSIGPLPDELLIRRETKKDFQYVPTALIQALEELSRYPEFAEWSQAVIEQVEAIEPASRQGTSRLAPVLQRLAQLVAQTQPMALATQEPAASRKIRQAGYAIQRRLDVWQGIMDIGDTALVLRNPVATDHERFALCLAEVDAATADSPEGQHWRDYLLLQAMKQFASRQTQRESDEQRRIAQIVLARMTQTPMTVRQRQFIDSPKLMALQDELQRYAAEPITAVDLLRDMECYEASKSSNDAKRLAADVRSLLVSSDSKRRELAERIDSHYRNANLRVALTENLLNRLIPTPPKELAPVRDTVLGIPVRGQSLTSSDVAIRLIPDPTHVRLALEVTGEVAAMTSSTAGPATFINDSNSLYAARKPMEIDQKGIRLMPAEVNVRNSTRLRDVMTDFDGIPIFQSIARNAAINQHEQNKPAANHETRRKVAAKARDRIDKEALDRLGAMVDKLNTQLFGPLAGLSLDPMIIEAQTTDQRMMMRMRVAGDDQLGGFTPRPQAPSNSLASFQINESLLNNIVQRLQLDGRTYTLTELAERIRTCFKRSDIWNIDEENGDLTVTFAPHDAVMVHCINGQVVMDINVTEMHKGTRSWKKFHVQVFYRPQVDGRSAELVRDGVVRLSGERLNLGSQITLRGVFAKAFPSNQILKLMPDKLVDDPKMNDLGVTQFVIDDGWIGIAVGSKQDALLMTQLPVKRK